MIADRRAVLLLLGIGTVAAAQAGEIPPAERLVARVLRTLSAPAEQPLNMPTDVAVDRTGRVYVADGVNDRVVRLKPDGTLDLVVGDAAGSKLSRPVGIFVDAQDRLWIADAGNGRIVTLSPTGHSESIAPPPESAGHAPDLTDIAVSPDGARLYAIDNDRHLLLIRETEGEWKSHGAFGRSLGQLEWPFMLAVSAAGDIYVSEAVGARVQRFSDAQQWVGSIGRWGVEPGRLYRPKGLAVDARDRLFVSDSTLGLVQAFDRRGGFLGVLTDERGGLLRFEHPMGMSFDSAGRLYVVELRPGRVAVVEMVEGPSK